MWLREGAIHRRFQPNANYKSQRQPAIAFFVDICIYTHAYVFIHEPGQEKNVFAEHVLHFLLLYLLILKTTSILCTVVVTFYQIIIHTLEHVTLLTSTCAIKQF